MIVNCRSGNLPGKRHFHHPLPRLWSPVFRISLWRNHLRRMQGNVFLRTGPSTRECTPSLPLVLTSAFHLVQGFFRRTINERDNQRYSCRNGGTCVITLATRNNCKSCRYRKCLSVGMSKDGKRIQRWSTWIIVLFNQRFTWSSQGLNGWNIQGVSCLCLCFLLLLYRLHLYYRMLLLFMWKVEILWSFIFQRSFLFKWLQNRHSWTKATLNCVWLHDYDE